MTKDKRTKNWNAENFCIHAVATLVPHWSCFVLPPSVVPCTQRTGWCPSLAGGCLQQGAEAVGELQRSHAWVLQLVIDARDEHRAQMSLFCRQTRHYAEAQPSQSLPSQWTEIMARSSCGLIHAQHLLCITSSTILHAVHKKDPVQKVCNLCLWYCTWSTE